MEWETQARRLQLTVGQQFLPVGIAVPREHWFSSNPPFISKLFGAAKAIDAGAVLKVQAFSQPWLSAEAGVFTGQLVREQDERIGDPEKAPRVASLKSRSLYHEAFVTYWEHDLAFFDPVRAWGAGGELLSPEVFGFKAGLLGELWQIEQIQRDGPDERTQAYLLNGELQYWRLTAGYRFSESRGRVVTALAAEHLPIERSRLAYLQVRLAPVLVLRAERVIEEQAVLLRDEWAGRILLNWNL